MVSRGEVWLVRLDPTEGREIQKTRPCLVVSPSEINGDLETLIAAPMTTGSFPAPYRIDVEFNKKANRILLEQIRTIDKTRLLRRLGTIDDAAMKNVLGTLRSMFAE